MSCRVKWWDWRNRNIFISSAKIIDMAKIWQKIILKRLLCKHVQTIQHIKDKRWLPLECNIYRANALVGIKKLSMPTIHGLNIIWLHNCFHISWTNKKTDYFLRQKLSMSLVYSCQEQEAMRKKLYYHVLVTGIFLATTEKSQPVRKPEMIFKAWTFFFLIYFCHFFPILWRFAT